MRDMVALERELLSHSKKDDTYRSEEMKVEMFRMSLVEKFCEYMDSYSDYFKRGALLLSNYQEEVSKTKSASRKQVEEILNFTLETDAEAAAESEAMRNSSASLNTSGSTSQHDGHPNPADVLPIFGTLLEETTQRDGTSVPRIVLHIVAYLDQMALSQMGIFRISGHNGSVQALREAIDSGHEVDLSLLNNAHVAATLFKLYLRRLPETLTLKSRFDEWISALGGTGSLNSSTDGTTPRWPDSVIESFAALVESLPPVYAATLDYLISFCTRVVAHSDQNMMGAKNLASLIAPNILNRPETVVLSSTEAMLEDVAQANRVVECLILNYDRIFEKISFDLKSQPFPSLEALAAEYPLCADRNVRHGMSVIVDLPPEEAAGDSSGKPQSDDARKRAVKKKTMSSISLLKDRKIKKKEKNVSEVRSTVTVGEADFKVFPSNSASLRPVSPRGVAGPFYGAERPNYNTMHSGAMHSDHQRTFSDIPTSSGASSPPVSPRTLPNSSSLKESRDSPLSSPRSNSSKASPPTSDEIPPRANSTATVHYVPTLTIPTQIHHSSQAITDPARPHHATQSSPTEKSPPVSPRDKDRSPRDKEKRHSKHPSKGEESDAPTGKRKKSTSKNRKSVAAKPTSSSTSATDVPETPVPTIIETTPTQGRHVRRHSIGLASEEGLDPTKENFGSLDATAAADIHIQSGTPSLSINNSLSVEALVDDNNGALSRRRANSRRSSSVLGNFTTTPQRSPSVTSQTRPVASPAKRKLSSTPSDILVNHNDASSAPSSSTSVVPPHIATVAEQDEPSSQSELKVTPAKNKRLSAQPPSLNIPSNFSSDGGPQSPTSKDTPTKRNKDRTSALVSVKFDNPEEFNKIMDENFGKGPIASYVVLGYNANNALHMQAGGEGGVNELVSHLRDDQIQYGLIRISYKEDGHALTRDVFVQWNGPKVSAIQKGIRKGHCGEVKNALCPTAIEILASSKSNFTLETLLARSAPTASRIID